MSRNQAFVVAVVLIFGKSQATPWKGPNQLHPVHGLYVKPSADGSTGDLYVAATEDSGTKTQWLTDQPINFLPVGAATHQHPTTVPYASSYSASAHDESQSTQKRAVITNPPVQYAYALPMSGATSEGTALSYPHAIPAVASTPTQSASTSSETSSTPQCADGTAAAVPYNPFQFFYPHLMSAYANAKSILKESGMSDDSAGAIVSQASPMWSPYSAYPMYVMVDPSAWAQSQATQTPTTASTNES